MELMKLITLDKVTSTQDEAFLLLDDFPEVAVMALEQTGGRGRRDHRWESPRGGLYLSIGWRNMSADEASRLNFSGPVAVVEILKEVRLEGLIKIPNDILVHGKKISGILIESRQGRTVLGIGLNVNQKSMENVQRATSIYMETERTYNLEDIARRLIEKIEELRRKSFSITLNKYRKHLIKGHARFRYRGEWINDVITDVDENLMVRGDKGSYNIFWMEDLEIDYKISPWDSSGT